MPRVRESTLFPTFVKTLPMSNEPEINEYVRKAKLSKTDKQDFKDLLSDMEKHDKARKKKMKKKQGKS